VEKLQKTESSYLHRGKGAGGTDPPTSPPFPVAQEIHTWKNNKKQRVLYIVIYIEVKVFAVQLLPLPFPFWNPSNPQVEEQL
jgi:hypothetical protein